ncbi:NDUF5-like protein [Mya arenaria]|uniref:Arginine-hydroxylase NDUFAF5, mitochondrial n=1 Tax=Mya arenaria TaxID=6604 RepID=A0ABY7F982_MYAAR|nr:NDUF5-like protein [Mya arenaria]
MLYLKETDTGRDIAKAIGGSQTCDRRCLSSLERGEIRMNVFDRKTKRLQRDRTALMNDYKIYEYIKEEIGYRLADRVGDIKREFPILVDLGCGRGYVSKHLLKDTVKTIYQCELSKKMLEQSEVSPEVPTYRLVADEEYFPFKDNSLDIVVSSLSLHWVNDLPGCFKQRKRVMELQVFRALKQDGVFLGCMFGGDTLFELRVALQLAEQEREGGFAAHVSPFTDARDLGNLLSRAGYVMTTLRRPAERGSQQASIKDIANITELNENMTEDEIRAAIEKLMEKDDPNKT